MVKRVYGSSSAASSPIADQLGSQFTTPSTVVENSSKKQRLLSRPDIERSMISEIGENATNASVAQTIDITRAKDLELFYEAGWRMLLNKYLIAESKLNDPEAAIACFEKMNFSYFSASKIVYFFDTKKSDMMMRADEGK
jgi:hypothetical protein